MIFKRASTGQVANAKRDTLAELKAKEEAVQIELTEKRAHRITLALAAVTAGGGSTEAEQYEQARKDEAEQIALLEKLCDARMQAQKEADEAERKSRVAAIQRRLDRSLKRWEAMHDNFGKLERSICETVAAYHAVLRDVDQLDFVGPAPTGCLTSVTDVVRAVSHQLHKANGPTIGPESMPTLPPARAPDINTVHNPHGVKPLSAVVAEADRIIRERIQTERSKLA